MAPRRKQIQSKEDLHENAEESPEDFGRSAVIHGNG